MSFVKFLKTKEFRKNVLRILLVYVLLAALIWLFLRWYTDHGDFVTVPEVKGTTLEEATTALAERNLDFMVVDSIYSAENEGGTVFFQSPEPESKVKEGRKIFLKVYALIPPMETINIEEGEFGNVAVIKLKNKGMTVNLKEEENNTLAGAVIRITHKGKRVKSGEQLPRGSDLTVYIGKSSKARVVAPNLSGLSIAELQDILDSHQLLLGTITFQFPESPSAADSVAARVCSQRPPYD
ncbi:MAG: PASTA domain-containing protein, partial [Flavobacteriales bacterium]|nr:PASTA domain-containing protein [Flavobacteriales bacterium]